MENLNFLLPATFIRGNSLLETILFPCIIVNLNFYFHLASRIFHITRILLSLSILISSILLFIFPFSLLFIRSSPIFHIYIHPLVLFSSFYFHLFLFICREQFFFSRNWEGYIVNIRASSHVAHYWKHYSRICIIVRSTSFSCRV